MSGTPEDGEKVLREEMDTRGYHNDDWRAGLAAIVGGESEFVPKRETGYSHTSNTRIRSIFSKAQHLSDTELDRIKSSDITWFDFIYGGKMGNTAADDGFKFRGGGFNQLTFRNNYALFGPKVGVDLIANPDLIIVPRIAAAVAVEYMKLNFHGGSFDAMKAAVGVSIGNPDDRKNQLYRIFTKSGEWDYRPGQAPQPQPPTPQPKADIVIADFLSALHDAEDFLRQENLYTGPTDNDPGPGFRAAIKAYLVSIQ